MAGRLNWPSPYKQKILKNLWLRIKNEHYKKLENPDYVVNIRVTEPPFPPPYQLYFMDITWAWAHYAQDVPPGALLSINLNH